jgi:hypothetical protein
MEAGMRKLRHAAVLVSVLLLPMPASAWCPPPDKELLSFNLTACCGSATHIVVVEPNGRVIESWRGDLKPGEQVFLGPEGLTPINAMPWEFLRLRPECNGGGWYHASSLHPDAEPEAASNKRLILFLRRAATHPNGSGMVWMPADISGNHPAAWLGRPQPGETMAFGFDYSRSWIAVVDMWASNAVWIEDGQVLAVQTPPVVYRNDQFRDNNRRLDLLAPAVNEFKQKVLMHPYVADKETGETPPEFNLQECARNATHIVVVNRNGEVLESWKGDTLPGEVIPLDKMCNPVLAQHLPELHKLTALPQDRDRFNPLLGSDRLVLFLVRVPEQFEELPVERPRAVALPLITREQLADADSEETRPGDITCWARGDGGYVDLAFIRRIYDDEGRNERYRQAVRNIAATPFARVSCVSECWSSSRTTWLPASRGGFACSMVGVDYLGIVHVRQSELSYYRSVPEEDWVGSRMIPPARMLPPVGFIAPVRPEEAFKSQVLLALYAQ